MILVKHWSGECLHLNQLGLAFKMYISAPILNKIKVFQLLNPNPNCFIAITKATACG
jgi:hypothetical protein